MHTTHDYFAAMIKPFARFILLMTCLMVFCPQSGRSEPIKLGEDEVKASYLYNFAKYVEWPATALPLEKATLIICVVGKSPLNEVIESLEGKSVKSRKLVIRPFSRIEDLNECHILFINAAVKTPIAQILAAAGSRPILTVSDSKGFTGVGGMIELVTVTNKIRFEINNRAAQKVRLRISSHLLRLAIHVIE